MRKVRCGAVRPLSAARPGGDSPVTPLLPGRFSWKMSPLALVGMVDLQLENSEALAQPVTFKGSWSQWQLSPSALLLPAEGLSGLGAPLNTLAPSGTMRLSWTSWSWRWPGPGGGRM
jgi:general secretion pathway protein N